MMVMVMVLMNNMLKHTWKACGNKEWLGSRTITIQSHGHFSR